MDLADAGGQRCRSDEPAHAPAGDREGLARAADRDRPLCHTRQRGQADVLAFVNEVLIDLVSDRERVVGDAQLGDQLELGPRVNLACRVVRRVDDDGPRPGVEGAPQVVGIKAPIRGPQGDVAGHRPAEDAVRAVVLVERLEDHDLVARIDRGEHGGDHGFGRSA